MRVAKSPGSEIPSEMGTHAAARPTRAISPRQSAASRILFRPIVSRRHRRGGVGQYEHACPRCVGAVNRRPGTAGTHRPRDRVREIGHTRQVHQHRPAARIHRLYQTTRIHHSDRDRPGGAAAPPVANGVAEGVIHVGAGRVNNSPAGTGRLDHQVARTHEARGLALPLASAARAAVKLAVSPDRWWPFSHSSAPSAAAYSVM